MPVGGCGHSKSGQLAERCDSDRGHLATVGVLVIAKLKMISLRIDDISLD